MAAPLIFFYSFAVPRIVYVTAKELAALAKRYRIAAGKNRAQAARELGVARVSLIHAEDFPGKSFFKLRKRIIEKYSPHKVVGPSYWLERK
jgi:DNA-binding XRE family transcriptional regulator